MTDRTAHTQCPYCGVYFQGYHNCKQSGSSAKLEDIVITVTPDQVNRPSHYNHGGIECIDAIRAALGHDGFIAYCRGNVIKYQWRADHKHGGEDLKKAAWYARMASGDDPRADA